MTRRSSSGSPMWQHVSPAPPANSYGCTKECILVQVCNFHMADYTELENQNYQNMMAKEAVEPFS
jgi:hypothetical protein